MNEQQFFQQLEDIIKGELKRFNVPSVSVGVIKDNNIVFAKGFGYRDIKNKLAADADTNYQIGSCSKAFTATLVCMLCDEGKLDLDTPIRNYVPEISFYDEFVSKECTLRDLLCHRTGLARHEFGWYGTSFTRQEMCENLKYYKPNKSFRSTWQYNNFAFILAGYICERVSGQVWEDLVSEKIFKPLGMHNTKVYIEDMKKDLNHAVPYDYANGVNSIDNEMVEIPYYKPFEDKNKKIGVPYGPAGSIGSTVNDMLKWVNFHLHNGKVNDQQLVSEKMMKEIHSPQMLCEIGEGITDEYETFKAYGLGWSISYYHHNKLISHTGAINGFIAFTSFVPSLNLGVVAYCNANSATLGFALGKMIINYYLDKEDSKLMDKYYEFTKEMLKEQSMAEIMIGKHVENTTCSHALNDLTGTYQVAGYQPLKVSYNDEKLTAYLNSWEIDLTHYHYDIFVSASKIPELPSQVPFNFVSNVKGEIVSVKVPLVIENGDDWIEFKKVA